MGDPFELLGLPRRPWLDADEVRRAYQERAREMHPDRDGGDAERFAELNAAQAVLTGHASRLRELLDGQTGIPSMPANAELGFRIATALRRADAACAGLPADSLRRALALTERRKAADEIASLDEEIGRHLADAEERLRAADAGNPDAQELAALAGEFVFLERWASQVRARRLELELLGSGVDGVLQTRKDSQE
jgi:DnaJ-class molecular chaperone with C-terminal Zn finger domain